MLSLLARLIDYCEAGLKGFPSSPPQSIYACPHCTAAGVSVIFRGGVLICCLVCGFPFPRLLGDPTVR